MTRGAARYIEDSCLIIIGALILFDPETYAAVAVAEKGITPMVF